MVRSQKMKVQPGELSMTSSIGGNSEALCLMLFFAANVCRSEKNQRVFIIESAILTDGTSIPSATNYTTKT